MDFQELPDNKARYSDYYKYIDEPLLEYVWKIANGFYPDYDGEDYGPSFTPVIFANRYIETKLNDEEKYARLQEINPFWSLETIKEYYSSRTKLDTSFKDKFLDSKEVLNTIKAFNLDLNKFWYLLLFVYDLVEDCCTNAPEHGQSEIKKIDEMAEKISESTEIIAKRNGKKHYETNDEYTLSILKASVNYFIKTYNDIIENSKNREERNARLKELGINKTIQDVATIKFEEKITLNDSHKIRLFTEFFQYFLKDLKADRKLMGIHTTSEDSTDKLLFISRLTYIVGLQDETYYKRLILKDGKYVANRKLSNLLSRYRDEPLPQKTGRYYSGWYK
jgi:hypothetical protein